MSWEVMYVSVVRISVCPDHVSKKRYRDVEMEEDERGLDLHSSFMRMKYGERNRVCRTECPILENHEGK